MTFAITMDRPGGPDVLKPLEFDLPEPGPGEIRLRHTVIGVNFVDIYHRTGLYPLPAFPATPGVEGAGVVEAIGRGASGFKLGQRVAYAGLPAGSYMAHRNIPAQCLVPVPRGLTDRLAGSSMLRGLTAHMLLLHLRPVQPGQWLLVHAGAGGLGQLLTRWARRLGAQVIATVGSASKAEVALEAGADHVVLRHGPGWAAEVRALAGGGGVDMAIDGIGGPMLLETLDAVRPFGLVASVGQAAGPVPPIDLCELGPKRSLSLARPSVFGYVADPARYRAAAADLFAALADGLANPVGAEYALGDAARAHADLEAGRTTGSIILYP